MEPSSREPAPQGDELLVHGRFLRGLARALVSDPERAEDLVQDTWTRALESPPRHGAAPRAWLAQILRRLAHKRGAREGERPFREDRAVRAAPERGPVEPAAIASEIEVSRQVLEGLERLDEPYRSTLYLRYYRGRTPALIAAEQRIPVKTVKTRLARGLELLRQALDRHHGGRREAWVAWLLPLASGPLPAPLEGASGEDLPAPSGLTAAPVLAAAAVVLAVGAIGGALWLAREDSRAPAPPAASAEPTRDAADAGPPAADARGTTATRRVLEAEPSAGAAPPTTVRLRGRALDPEGRPLTGVEVVARVREAELRGGPFRRGFGQPPGGDGPEARTRSDADGDFALLLERPGLARLTLEQDGFAPVARQQLVFLGQDLDLGVFVLEPGLTLAGRVLDEDGRPVPEAELWQERPEEGLLFGTGAAQVERVGWSDADGRFELRRVAAGAWRLEVRSPRHAVEVRSGEDARAGERLELELVLARGEELLGRVLGLSPAERERATVLARPLTSATPSSTRLLRASLDATGAFELLGLAPAEEVELLVALEGPDGERRLAGPNRARVGEGEVRLEVESAAAASLEPKTARAAPAGPEAGEGAVELRVLRSDGTPAPGALVMCRATQAGPRAHGAGDVRAADASGRLSWPGLVPGVHAFRVVTAVLGVEAVPGEGWTEARVEDGSVCALELRAAPGADLLGIARVAGRPLAGAEVLLRRDEPRDGGRGPGRGPWRGMDGPALVLQTGPDGGFAFEELLPGSYRLELFHPARALPELRTLELGAGTTELVLELGQIHASGRVRALDGGALVGVRVRALVHGEERPRDEHSRREGRAERARGETSTDEAGFFELAGLEPDRPVRLQVSSPGYATRTTEALPPEVFQELVLEPEARLELELECDVTGPLLLVAQGPRGERRQGVLSSARTVHFDGLAPGAWELELRGGDPDPRAGPGRGPRPEREIARRTLELRTGSNRVSWVVP